MLAYWIQGNVSYCFVTAIAFLVFKEPLSRPRLLGLIANHDCASLPCCLFYVSLNRDVWKGDLLFYWREFLLGGFNHFAVTGPPGGGGFFGQVLPPLAATGLAWPSVELVY